MEQTASREQIIIRTSVIGIAANILLAAFKAAVGLVSGSIAIVLDAVNNLSDALSSIITIAGTKLAGKTADRQHPYGHGRIEYVTAMLISMIVLYAGITSLIESVKKILNPVTPDYSAAALVIVASAVVVKLVMGRYVKSIGKKVNSDSLINSGQDAMMDSIISASTLVAAIIYITSGISLEAYLGVVISGFIIKAGIDMLRDTLSTIIGERMDSSLTREIKASICEEEAVKGAYDLILHNYGPDTLIGSVHVEIPDTMTANDIDIMTRRIQSRIYEKFSVILAAVGIYSLNTSNDEVAAIRSRVTELVMSHDGVLQLHGFFLDMENKTMSFDIIIDFDLKKRNELYEHIYNDVHEEYPEYKLNIANDADISD